MSESLSQKVARLETERNDAVELCSVILATLTLEQNKVYFDLLPEDFKELVSGWVEEFKILRGSS